MGGHQSTISQMLQVQNSAGSQVRVFNLLTGETTLAMLNILSLIVQVILPLGGDMPLAFVSGQWFTSQGLLQVVNSAGKISSRISECLGKHSASRIRHF